LGRERRQDADHGSESGVHVDGARRGHGGEGSGQRGDHDPRQLQDVVDDRHLVADEVEDGDHGDDDEDPRLPPADPTAR
jgi:hypothetical protein